MNQEERKRITDNEFYDWTQYRTCQLVNQSGSLETMPGNNLQLTEPRNRCRKCWTGSKTNFLQICTLFFLALCAWGIALSLFGLEQAGPDSQIFRLAILFILAKIAGVLIGLLKIPPMLGMLAVGVLLRNIGFLNLTGNYLKFASVLRQVALVNILLPAGLGLDPSALKRMSWLVLLLAVVPPLAEVAVVTVLSKFTLSIPWLWGILLGFLLSAVSPAVVIPCLFELQEKGYGVNKGVHTLVIAASTLNDIKCIACFGIFIGIIFSKGSLTMQLLEGPIVIVIGFAYGIALGLLAWKLPDVKDAYLVTLRTLVIGFGSILASVGSQAVGYGGAGTLGCIVGAFVASLGWRKQGWGDFNPVKQNFSLLWKFFEPISFGLIGMEVRFEIIERDVALWGTLAMMVALLVRMAFSMMITKWSNLNLKEMLFVAISWIPKATVQAALGPVALDYAREGSSKDMEQYGNVLLIIAVISIIITSPIGALLIMQLGPRLLHRTIRTDEGHTNIATTIEDETHSKL